MLLNEVGLQLYSLKDECARDFAATLENVARMGYSAVEFAGYGGLTGQALKKLLEDNQLQAWGAHVGLDRLNTALDQEIEINLAVGSRCLVCPYAEMKTRDDALRLADALNEANRKIAPLGMKLGYHNHAHEFATDGGKYLLDILFEQLDQSVFAELDVFWVAYAGVDPVAYIQKYAGRQQLIHLKELAANGRDNPEIGSGKLDFTAIINAAREAGVNRFIVEQEEYTCPPLQSCKKSLDALKCL